MERSILIKTTPEKIWEMLAADRIPDWQPYMAKSKKREYITEINFQEDKYQVGATYRFDKNCHFEVFECIAMKKIDYRFYENSFLGFFEGHDIYSIEPVKNGCKFTYTVEGEGDYPNMISKMLIGNYFVQRWMEKQIETNVKMLREILEKES